MTPDLFISQLCEHCGLSADQISVEVVSNEDGTSEVKLTVPEEDSGLFIGFHGETLESIQRIVRILFQESPEQRILVNVNGYREQRQEKLEEITARAAETILSDAQDSYDFQSYLPSYERFIVHSALSKHPRAEELESISQGEGRDRRLTIRRKQS